MVYDIKYNQGGYVMKIAIPVEEKSSSTKICISFGRTPYFLVFDDAKKEYNFLENTAAESRGGAGVKAAQFIVDNKVDVLLAPRCGENEAEIFNTAKVKLYKTINDSVEDNLKAFSEGKLELLQEVHPGFHHGN